MKIYTRTGDEGKTGLYGGARVRKDDLRVEAYGTVDEANALVGLARAQLGAELLDGPLDDDLAAVQNALFDVGADLATPLDARTRASISPIDGDDVVWLERAIDRWDAELEPLRAFILPGGAPAGAALQVARAVMRRAERRVVALAAEVELNDQLAVWLNRSSDLLFVLARVVNAREGAGETRWAVKGRTRPETEG